MNEMTLDEYQALAARTINKDLLKSEAVIYHAIFGMCGEVGEIASIYQKRYQGHVIDKDDLKKETGDLLWFISELCSAMGWSLGDVAEANIAKLKKRYPDGFSADRSVNRGKYEGE